MPIKELKPDTEVSSPTTSAAAGSLDRTWFSSDQVEAYREAVDENELARAIAVVDPAGSEIKSAAMDSVIVGNCTVSSSMIVAA